MALPRAAVLALVALLVPALAAPLEPRFDHRDTHGPFVEALAARDTIALPAGGSRSAWRPAARAGWGLDVGGEGDELLAGATVSLRSFDDPERTRVLLAADLRYRAYFGSEEAKTFFDVGVWAPLASRLAVGPLVGAGFQYDLSRAAGLYAGASFATGFGEARIASFAIAVGAQLRFDRP